MKQLLYMSDVFDQIIYTLCIKKNFLVGEWLKQNGGLQRGKDFLSISGWIGAFEAVFATFKKSANLSWIGQTPSTPSWINPLKVGK